MAITGTWPALVDRPPWTGRRTGFTALIVLGTGLFIASWLGIHMGLLSLFGGIGNIVRFLGQNVPPQFVDFGHTAYEALITVCIAILGTSFAVLFSLPVGFMAARNTTVNPAVRWVARAIIVACRSVPDLVFAIIFVEALGVGVLPGILALAFHSVGMLGKLYAEAIEEVPVGPPEAVRSCGARRLQIVMTSVVPQVLPSFSSMALYRLDINLRSSVILGYVGAGGIGFLLNEYTGEVLFRPAMGIVVVMFVLIVLMEVFAAVVRRSLIGNEGFSVNWGRSGRKGQVPEAQGERRWSVGAGLDRSKLRPPWTRERVHRYSFLAGAVVLFGASCAITRTLPWQVVTSLPRVADTVSLYFPPDFQAAGGAIVNGALQSLAVAIVATTVGYTLAVPIGLAAARNVSRPAVARATRLFLLVVRAVPELVLAIVFIVAVGLGLVAGALALVVGTVGFVAKLVADGFEEVPAMPREAVVSVGATRAQETVASVLSPSVPMLAGDGFYMLDINFRSSTILGLVGGGGLGYLLWQSVNQVAYRTTGAIILVTFVVVLLIEGVTNWARKHLI